MDNFIESQYSVESQYSNFDANISSYSRLVIHPGSTALNNNKTLILRLIKDAGTISRKDLAFHSNLTPASITAIIRELIAKGLVQESGLVSGTHGRRMTGLSLVTDRFCTISGRITSHYFAVGIYDINSKCIDVKKTYFDVFGDIRASTEAIAAQIYYYIDMAHDLKLEPLALAFGLMGEFRITPDEYIMIGNDGRYMDLKAFFTHEFDLPCYCDNSNILSMYNFACDAKFNYLRNETVALVGISYGIDTTLMSNRHVLPGAVNIPGAAGKTIMLGSSLEDFETLEDCISTQATIDRAKREAKSAPYSSLKDLEDFTIRDLINAFYEGDPVAISVYNYVSNILGRYLTQLITLVRPHKIYICDEIPLNDTFERMLVDSTRHQLSRNTAYFPDIICIHDFQRQTRFDFAIRGASLFVTNKILQSTEWLESLKELPSVDDASSDDN